MSGYENMLEKYRDVDEDAIMSGLSKDELARLENEIDREILEKLPEYNSDESDMYTTTTDDEQSNDFPVEHEINRSIEEVPQPQAKDETQNKGKPEAFVKGKLDRTQLKPVHKPLQRQRSGGKHTFKLPALKNTQEKIPDKPCEPEDNKNSELKNELIQAVTKRNKRRTRRGNSSGISVRRLSNAGFHKGRRNSKVTRYRDGNEHQIDAAIVNRNMVTDEMLNLRPRLRKVAVKEPKLILPDELHGVSFNRITAGAKKLLEEDDIACEAETVASDEGDVSRNSACGGYDADNDVTPSLSDDSYVVIADDIEDEKEHYQALSECSEGPSDGVITMASPRSTSAESCDLFGELSINPNSVEEMIERVLENDPALTEVNLNNIRDVPIERFEELAQAMEKNTHVMSLTLANTGLTDRAARAMATMLKKNSTIKKLNLESNFITGDGARCLASALRKNKSLIELLLDNQRHIFGTKVEFEIAKLLKENSSLLKFGYQFANPGPRMATTNILSKNMDVVRKKRVAEEKKRQQAGLPKKPHLRRQLSSDKYRRDKVERLKKLQHQTGALGLDLNGGIGDGDVKRVLKNMKEDEIALLERWFTAKLLAAVDKTSKDAQSTAEETDAQCLSGESTSKVRPDESKQPQSKEKETKLKLPPGRRRGNKSPAASRDELMKSIRKQNSNLKKVQLQPFESPPHRDKTNSDVDVKTTELKNPTKQSNAVTKTVPHNSVEVPDMRSACKHGEEDHGRHATTILLHTEPSLQQVSHTRSKVSDDRENHENPRCSSAGVYDSGTRSSSSPEIREWVEGEEYDSDEYEIFEVEVTDTEEETDLQERCKDDKSGKMSPTLIHARNNNNNNGTHLVVSEEAVKKGLVSIPKCSSPTTVVAPPLVMGPASCQTQINRDLTSLESGWPSEVSSDERSDLISTDSGIETSAMVYYAQNVESSNSPPRSSGILPSGPQSTGRSTTARNPIDQSPKLSPSSFTGRTRPASSRTSVRSENLSLPQSPPTRQRRSDIPTHSQRQSEMVADGVVLGAPRSSSGYALKQTHSDVLLNRSKKCEEVDEEKLKICPKAMSTIESFFTFK